MNQELQRVRERLRAANMERGKMAQVSRDSGVSTRTLYNVLHSEGNPNLATLDKLAAYFKKIDRKAKQQ